MQSVSAIILTKDSQRTIEACILALKPAVDHIIVVDTGSTDDTVHIAKDLGVYVYNFEWCEDFAAARNFGDSLATTDWVIHVDSDEILRNEDKDKIRKVCVQYRKTVNPIAIGIQVLSIIGETTRVDSSSRMYRRGILTWRGIIHEQLFSRRGSSRGTVQSDIGVIHDGYNPTVVNLRSKYMRNIRLLQRGLEREPNNFLYHFFIGRDYMLVDEHRSSIPHLRLAIDLMEHQNKVALLEDAHHYLGRCYEVIGDYSGAEEVAKQMSSKFSNYAEGWYHAPTQETDA